MILKLSCILLFFLVIFSTVLAKENEENELIQEAKNVEVDIRVVKREADPLPGKSRKKKCNKGKRKCGKRNKGRSRKKTNKNSGKNKNSNKPNKGNRRNCRKGKKCQKRNKGRSKKGDKTTQNKQKKKTKKSQKSGKGRNKNPKRKPQKTTSKKKNGKPNGKNRRNKKRQRKLKKTTKESQKQQQSKNKNNNLGRQTFNCTSCLEKIRFYSRLFEGKATVIIKQVTRIKGNDKVQESKKKKKGEFSGTAEVLLSALGGNISKPTCDGVAFNVTSSSNSSRAVKLLRAAPTNLNTLTNCNTDIEKACGVPVTGDATKLAELEACSLAASNFKTAFSKCLLANISSAAACTCTDAISASDITALQKCDTSKDNDKALKLKKACKKSVGTCKTAQGESVESVNTCKPKTKCGGAKDKAEAEKLIKILSPLSDALKNPAIENALISAGLDKGTGSDGKVPASGRIHYSRVARATDGEGCKAIEKGFENFNKTAGKAVGEGPSGKVDEKETTNTIGILNGINTRKDLVGDLKGCAKESRQISGTVTVIVRIRVYFFWCVWFRVTIVEVQITVLVATFGATTPTSSITTKAPTGRHNLLSSLRNKGVL